VRTGSILLLLIHFPSLNHGDRSEPVRAHSLEGTLDYKKLTGCSYYQSDKYTDVTIRFGGQDRKMHKVVLAAGSQYFRAAFESSFKVGFGSFFPIQRSGMRD